MLSELITICIPTKDNLPTIKLILVPLSYQDCFCRIIIMDNGSKDGTLEAVQAMIKNNIFRDLKVELINFGEWSGVKEKNIEKVRYEFSQVSNTKYLMFIDADVLIPPYVIEGMINTMEKNEKIGMLGLKYDVLSDHVKMGATILRTELAKKIKWKYDEEKCDCLYCAEQIVKMGFSVQHFPVTARHLLAF